ncbi:MAG: acetyl-CoA carboxylase biotin carboxyl carrier protein subunit [Candidatus Eisenbacteria bacterium]|uniref:Acetyl-CoA carboxylase biotin carboxyl carrier protein subunit n=1 Tax=Eiseniibacteriota bacterium TaxID=2212470 RepID=A0A948WCZ3_UNCEI|nr:acetyl-CoA carboxylase biotin carboxyl carrier protein subunit [Candidatus Eisenbacteria bacterium]MBU1947112.1 acetyl-CoA carboxylase biotin carboxyl carrier protein subunit [Candidatus Eisenbacteria bacterium]MBU2691358.1 acetyl-CoA carboxylase biotin carboxyl carrier protein subunit [Candidatus Eisenbacteria bacterium]
MNYEFQVGEETTTVHLERTGDGFKIGVGDATFSLKAEQIHPGTFVLLAGHRSIMAHAVKGDGVWHVSVDGRAYDLRLPGTEDHGGDSGDDGPRLVDGVLQTPMPGRVVAVEVKENDRVEAGQVLIIIESMKMQNSIVSPVSGRIVKVHKETGELASFGDPLVELEEEDPAGDA